MAESENPKKPGRALIPQSMIDKLKRVFGRKPKEQPNIEESQGRRKGEVEEGTEMGTKEELESGARLKRVFREEEVEGSAPKINAPKKLPGLKGAPVAEGFGEKSPRSASQRNQSKKNGRGI